MYLLRVFRRERNLSRPEALRILKSEDGCSLRTRLGFEEAFPSPSGLRYFEGRISPQLQQEINALQMDMLYQAGLLPTRPDEQRKVTLSFDGMLHAARARMRCAHVTDSCYQQGPRPCPARDKGKRGCDCTEPDCVSACHHTTPLDPQARFVVYTGGNKHRRPNPNAPTQQKDSKRSRSRSVYGYYSYAGQILDDERATYWILPAAFGPATRDQRSLFPRSFPCLRRRFPWLQMDTVIADAGAGHQCCQDLI
jgi:hypothetical protein